MAFASFDSARRSAPVSDINMVPLIDVMLVLLVIFIVTAPLLSHAVKLELPRADSRVNPPTPDRIEFSIDAGGGLYWNGERIERGEAARRFAAASAQSPQPELHLRADQDVAYRHVAQALADASRAGLGRIGFVSQPNAP